MNKKLLPLLIAGVCAMPSAFAASDAAILKRLDQLEAQRKADQAEIQALRDKVQQLETQKPINSDEAAKLHEEIVSVDKKAASRVDSVKHSIDAEREKLKINGYMSVYGTKSTDSAVTLGNGIDNHIGFKSDTIAAIQFDYQVNSNIDAVVQLQSAGNNEYQVEASWAFLRYNLSPSTKIRAGRMVAPVYLYADSIDVGYTYPWVRPPVEMYGTTPIRYQGVDVLQNFNFGRWSNTLQVFYGDNDGTVGGVSVTSNYLAGVGLTLNNDAWTLRTSFTHADNVGLSSGGSSSATGAIDYLSGAVRYDDGSLFALVEGKKVKTKDDLNTSLPTVEGFYTTLGYQLREFMPYVTWAKAYSVDDGNVAAPFLKQSQESVGLGLRYNLTDKVVLKGEATKYNHFDGTPGITSFTDLNTYLTNPAVSQRLDDDGVTLMSFGFDAIF
jgi:hypothetical protein